MKASLKWLSASGAKHSAGSGREGQAHLRHYSATYKEWGEGPPLVLVPGLAGGHELLGSLARLLSTRFRVISYQIRGEDDPFALRQRFGLHDLVRDLDELMNWLELEQPILMGVSFGGLIALELAARRPHRIDRLIVQGVGASFQRSMLQRIAGQVLSSYPLPTDNPFVNQFFNLLFGGRPHSVSLFRHVTQKCWQTDQSVMAHRFKMAERFDVRNRLDRVKAPTLVLSGKRDVLVSKKGLGGLREGLEKCQFVEISGSGHLASVTHPRRVAEEVFRFTA